MENVFSRGRQLVLKSLQENTKDKPGSSNAVAGILKYISCISIYKAFVPAIPYVYCYLVYCYLHHSDFCVHRTTASVMSVGTE